MSDDMQEIQNTLIAKSYRNHLVSLMKLKLKPISKTPRGEDRYSSHTQASIGDQVIHVIIYDHTPIGNIFYAAIITLAMVITTGREIRKFLEQFFHCLLKST